MFITIGQNIINLDQVTHIKFTEDGSAAYVHFDKDNVLTLDSEGATRIKKALERMGA